VVDTARQLKKVATVREAIEAAKRDPELRAALLRELGCTCIIDGQKALPAPEEVLRHDGTKEVNT
jgi:hypothetical protein